MEGMPDFEGLEAMEQPDLLEAFADQEVTMFGFTGTFKDLANMCPVDLSDPRVTLEAKNEFVIKAANEAGLEIEPKHEELFARVTERLGLERKFTVAASATEAPKVEPARELREQPAVTPKPDVVAPANGNRTETPRQVEPAAAEDIAAARHELPDAALPTIEQLSESIILPEPIASETHDMTLRDQFIELPGFLRPEDESSAAAAVEAQPDDRRRRAIHDDESADNHDVVVEESRVPTVDFETLLAQIEAEAANAPAAADTLFAPVQIGNMLEIDDGTLTSPDEDILDRQQTAAPEDDELIAAAVDWGDELKKEPMEIFEDFTEALRSFTELPATPVSAAEGEPLSGLQSNGSEAEDEHAAAPPILAAVSERLAELQPDEQELAAPILKDIVGAIHGIQLLESQAADPEMVESVEAQLESLCVALFETIGVEYDEEDIKQFVRMLLHPGFQPPRPATQAALDLEHMGTHEVKRHFSYLLTNGLTDVEYELEQLLGKFALFRASITSSRRDLALTA